MNNKTSLKLRIKKLNSARIPDAEIKDRKSLIYIMSRDQRVRDNHTLIALYEHFTALKSQLSEDARVVVYFNLYPKVKNRIYNQYEWMIEGLKKVSADLNMAGIDFVLGLGKAIENYGILEKALNPAAIYFDFSPLRGPQNLLQKFSKISKTPLYIVDTHNIVPVWEASEKEEFAAYTIRKDIHERVEYYLEEPVQNFLIKSESSSTKIFNDLKGNNKFVINPKVKDWDNALKNIETEKIKNYNPVVESGEDNALKTLDIFLNTKLLNYADQRNDPSESYQSNLSAYLHFGQVSSLRITLELRKFLKDKGYGEIEFSKEKNKALTKYTDKNLSLKQRMLISAEAFLEELIVRKELSDNFCFYNKNYDNFNGLKDWAKNSLNKHRKDLRKEIFKLSELEFGKTYDEGWNAAQKQLIKTGKMHGYMRMYWAKKILEWTETPEQAIEYTIYLNDKYSLDGYDPNGYVGIMWSIGGIHDRAWFEREIFGKIRYMNFSGLKRKFDIEKYIQKWS